MLNDKGRKVIREKIGERVKSYDEYKGIKKDEAVDFDADWDRIASDLGFKPSVKAIGYGGGEKNEKIAESRGLAMPSKTIQKKQKKPKK